MFILVFLLSTLSMQRVWLKPTTANRNSSELAYSDQNKDDETRSKRQITFFDLLHQVIEKYTNCADKHLAPLKALANFKQNQKPGYSEHNSRATEKIVGASNLIQNKTILKCSKINLCFKENQHSKVITDTQNIDSNLKNMADQIHQEATKTNTNKLLASEADRENCACSRDIEWYQYLNFLLLQLNAIAQNENKEDLNQMLKKIQLLKPSIGMEEDIFEKENILTNTSSQPVNATISTVFTPSIPTQAFTLVGAKAPEIPSSPRNLVEINKAFLDLDVDSIESVTRSPTLLLSITNSKDLENIRSEINNLLSMIANASSKQNHSKRKYDKNKDVVIPNETTEPLTGSNLNISDPKVELISKTELPKLDKNHSKIIISITSNGSFKKIEVEQHLAKSINKNDQINENEN